VAPPGTRSAVIGPDRTRPVTTLPTPAAPGLSPHYSVGMADVGFEEAGRRGALDQTRERWGVTGVETEMRDEYDFSSAQTNPYADPVALVS